MRLLALALVCVLNVVGIAAFEGFFGNMFHQPQHHQQQRPRGHSPGMWQEQADAGSVVLLQSAVSVTRSCHVVLDSVQSHLL